MNNKIIFINCPPWGVLMPPLGIAYLVTYLKSRGIPAEVCDLNLQLHKEATARQRKFWDFDTINTVLPSDIANDLWTAFEDVLDSFIRTLGPYQIIACSANNLISTTFAGILAKRIKERSPEKVIVLGGPGCFHSWDRRTIKAGSVDFFVIGEGEDVFYQLVRCLTEYHMALPDSVRIPGVLRADKGRGQIFIPSLKIGDLDTIPFPTFEEFDLSRYGNNDGYRPLPMIISRGCINRCSYCVDHYMCSPFRTRSAAHLIAELRHHKERYGTTHVELNDLLCNGNLYQLEHFCDALIQAQLDINWISYAAVRRNMGAALLEKMRKAGCVSLCYGVESGSDAVLRNMNKHYSKDEAAAVIRMTYAAGIKVRINIIVGFPNETEADFQETLHFIRENRKYISQVTNVSSFVLMAGSDLGIYPHRFGITFLESGNPSLWTDSNGLTQAERNDRVARTCRCLEELGINNLIVNYQKEAGQNLSAQKEAVATEERIFVKENGTQSGYAVITSTGQEVPRRGAGKVAALLVLFLFSLVIDCYLFLLKKVRGSVIFPGS